MTADMLHVVAIVTELESESVHSAAQVLRPLLLPGLCCFGFLMCLDAFNVTLAYCQPK